MERFNLQTGEFGEYSEEQKKILLEGKKMKTKDGKIVLLFEGDAVFDPARGEFLKNIKPEDLEELK
ncbi:MAG: hypothetical protein WC264_03795 [Candidatus Paceibacterota bacterium]|jgi:hypothetical protein